MSGLGQIYVELDLDFTKFERNQQKVLQSAKSTSLSVEKNWQTLGAKSDTIYQAMANGAVNAYNMIANRAKTSAEEQFRAQSAMVAKINSLNAEMKKPITDLWDHFGVRSSQAILAEIKATNEKYAKIHAMGGKSARDIVELEAAKVAKINALTKEMTAFQDAATKKRVESEQKAALEIAVIREKENNVNAQYWLARMQYEKRAVGERVAREREAAVIAQAPYEALGIRSAAAIRQQISAVEQSYQILATKAKDNSAELIRLEKAKNDKLKDLNNEMVGVHEKSMASMTRAVLRLYAAYYILSQGVNAFIAPFKKGFDAVESYNKSVAAMAAMVMTFSEKQKDITMAEQWRESLKYSSAMVPILERIAARTLLSGEETTALGNAFARSGVFLDANNQKAIEGFTRISNALPLMTQGQEIMRQINTEIRSLMTGQNEQSSMMLQALKAMPGFSTENLRIWRQQGTVLEHIGELLVGFGPATDLLENSWQAVKTTIDTTVTQQLRGMMVPVYDEIIKQVKTLDSILQQNQNTIKKWGEAWANQFAFAIDSIKATVKFAELFFGSPYMARKPHGVTRDFGLPSPPKPGPLPPSQEELAAAEKAKKEAEALEEKRWKAEQDSLKVRYDLQKKGAEERAQIELDTLRAEIKLRQESTEAMSKSWDIYYKNLDDSQDKETDRQRDLALEEVKLRQTTDEELIKSWEIYYENLFKQREEDFIAVQKGEEAIRKAKEATQKAEQKADKERYRAGEQYYKMMFDEENFSTNKFVEDMNYMLSLEKEKYRKLEELGRKAGKTEEQIEKDKLKIAENYSKKRQQLVGDGLVAGLSDMERAFNNISSMYDKNSSEYARMQEAARMMIVLQDVMAVKNAVVAISAAAGAPFPAGFIAMASMAASMTALLASAGIAFGGGGGGASYTPAAGYGGSTVLGAVLGTGSESISNVYKLLEDTYTLEYRELTGIHNNMKDLNRNITGLVQRVVRSGVGAGSFGDLGTPLNFGQAASKDIMNIPVLGPLMKAFDALTGGVFGSIGRKMDEGLFGSSTTSQTSTGISVSGAKSSIVLLGDLINKEQLLVQGYADMKKETSGAMFGLFGGGGTESWTEFRSLDSSISTMITNVFRNLSTAMLEINKGIGDSENISNILGYQLKIGKIDLTGLDGEGINKKISETISNLSDKMVEDLFGNLISSYQQINEGLMETAVRLMTNKEIVIDTLNMTGQAFVGSTADLIAFSESVISIAGDLDKFRSAAEDYYNAFFTDEEKQTRLQDQLMKAMAEINQLLPEARQGYRDLVEGLDLQTQSGAEAYVTMMQLSKSADEYYSALEAVADKQDELTQSLREQVDTISAWISEMMRSNLAPVQSLQVWGAEYIKQRQLAMATGASEKDVAGYLNYAKDYLSNQKTMGGEYKDIFGMVMRDVLGLQGGVEDSLAQRQLDAAKALSEAAVNLTAAGNVLIFAGGQTLAAGNPALGETVNSKQQSGYGITWEEMQEIARGNIERPGWSKFGAESILNKSGIKFGGNTSTGPQSIGSGDITLELSFPIIIDGAEVDRITAKRVLSGGELQSAIDKRIRMVA